MAMQGTVVSSAPSYDAGKDANITLTTGGELRVTVVSNTGGGATAANQTSEIAALGGTTDANQPDGTGNGSIIALLKGWLVAAGLKADAAYSGSGAAGIISLLKGIYANTALSRTSVTITDGAAHTASFQTAPQTSPAWARGAMIWINFGTVSGTTPTDSLVLQWSPDGGTSWVNYGGASANVTGSSFVVTIFIYPGANANMTTGANVVLNDSGVIPTTWRLSHVIGGTTPSFTVNNTFINYLP